MGPGEIGIMVTGTLSLITYMQYAAYRIQVFYGSRAVASVKNGVFT